MTFETLFISTLCCQRRPSTRNITWKSWRFSSGMLIVNDWNWTDGSCTVYTHFTSQVFLCYEHVLWSSCELSVTGFTKTAIYCLEIIIQRRLLIRWTYLETLYMTSCLRTMVDNVVSIYQGTLWCFGSIFVAPSILMLHKNLKEWNYFTFHNATDFHELFSCKIFLIQHALVSPSI